MIENDYNDDNYNGNSYNDDNYKNYNENFYVSKFACSNTTNINYIPLPPSPRHLIKTSPRHINTA